MRIRFILAIFYFLCLSSVFSQVQIQDPLSGRLLSVSKYGGINGNPFLNDRWMKGDVTTKKGVYANILLKYDAFSNVLYFNRNDELFEFEDEVLSFVLKPNQEDSSTFKFFVKGLDCVDVKTNQFLQELCKGTLGFYKATIVFLSEMNKINEGVVKNFQKGVKYYFKSDGKMAQVMLNKKDLLALVEKRQSDVESYATAEGLSFKKENDVIKILAYYNALK